jgi:hypothetical protein
MFYKIKNVGKKDGLGTVIVIFWDSWDKEFNDVSWGPRAAFGLQQ